ncbi:hypothetical protein A2U01_0101987, partial [Trifolium medium]|nr:hypothetical protein [Trifolium medium]
DHRRTTTEPPQTAAGPPSTAGKFGSRRRAGAGGPALTGC